MMSLKETLGNETWLKDHEKLIKDLFPIHWTAIDKLKKLNIGKGLKKLGIDYKTEQEFAHIMIFFEKIGFLEAKDNCVKVSTETVIH
ncbi:MAG: hypothetical protein COW84_00215 [Gammaproteobacteria bacterium CG22_combo_CG10-13_8_21_14_all_40_8]|nr:MAG: hypothetical protein COW84_00215 [Gammaproteobacteria bacterium CG22_combo_CG10-13_8_21_14_all_40_8]